MVKEQTPSYRSGLLFDHNSSLPIMHNKSLDDIHCGYDVQFVYMHTYGCNLSFLSCELHRVIQHGINKSNYLSHMSALHTLYHTDMCAPFHHSSHLHTEVPQLNTQKWCKVYYINEETMPFITQSLYHSTNNGCLLTQYNNPIIYSCIRQVIVKSNPE